MASNWNAGDGYQVTSDYLVNLPDYASGGGAGLSSGYSGGVNTAYKSLIQPDVTPAPAVNYGSGSNSASLGQGISIPTSVADGSMYGAIGGGVGAIAGAYNGASEDTGSSVLSGAASGAAAGTAIMPGWGTAIGAVIGGIAGYFGSKSKKKKANQDFQNALTLQTASQQQAQANYLQKEKLTQAAMTPYAQGYTPRGYQYKNNLFGGAKQNNSFAQPGSGQLNIPDAPPQLTSPGLGKPLTTNMPQPSYSPGPMAVPTNTFNVAPPTTPVKPQYQSGNAGANQANISEYARQLALSDYQKNQQAAADAMNPYSAYFNQGYG